MELAEYAMKKFSGKIPAKKMENGKQSEINFIAEFFDNEKVF